MRGLLLSEYSVFLVELRGFADMSGYRDDGGDVRSLIYKGFSSEFIDCLLIAPDTVGAHPLYRHSRDQRRSVSDSGRESRGKDDRVWAFMYVLVCQVVGSTGR